MALLLALFFATALFLTQSRSAWFGIAAGLAAMAWLHWRWTRWLIFIVALFLVLAFMYAGPGAAVGVVFRAVSPGGADMMVSTVSMAGRLEIWSRALHAIRDFAFTGFGLGSFGRAVDSLYPLFLMGPDGGTHAHNIFLEVALSLGVPGLIAYISMVGIALWVAWRTATFGQGRLGDSSRRWLATGIVGSLVAFHVFGLTDTIFLEAKPGVALWVLLALAAALWNTAQTPRIGWPESTRFSRHNGA
jgi:putative inorganic carbon (HCO3(-)) transporter